MKENRTERTPSPGVVVGGIAAIAIAAMILVAASAAWNSKQDGGGRVVPETGTVEYEEYVQQFEADHGREWTEQDRITAIYNGIHVQIGVIGYLFSIALAYFEIWNWYWYLKDRKAYTKDKTNPEPPSIRHKLAGTAVILAVILCFGGYMWLIAPHLVKPII